MDYKDFGLTKEQYEECIELMINKKIDKSIDIDWQEICEMYNLSYHRDVLRKSQETIFGGAFVASYYRDKYLNAVNTPNIDNKNYSSLNTINKDGTYSSSKLISMNEEQAKDVSFILNAHGFDDKSWKLVSAKNNIRQVVSKQDGVVTLYASFITVKPITDLNLKDVESFYKELCNKYETPTVKRIETKGKYMYELPIMDLHFGKLSLSDDVSEPYNYILARERFNYIIDDSINNIKNYDIDEIIFPIGSDFFNIDNMAHTTTAGTRQDNDLSPQLIFKYGMTCLIDGIIKLSNIAKVKVFCVNGNHDFLSSYHAVYSLWCYFHNNENVDVDLGTSPRKYVQYGKSLIGFSHGDKEKQRLDGLMQIEAKELWGVTDYHEFHCGHLHSERAREDNGIIFRNLSSVCGTDMWHHTSGYVGAIKKCQSFLWHKEDGLKVIFHTVVK